MNEIKWIKKDFDEINKYLYSDHLSKKDFEDMFIQNVKVLNIIVEDDSNINTDDEDDVYIPDIRVICEYESNIKMFCIPESWCCWYGKKWEDYKNADIDFYKGDSQNERYIFFVDHDISLGQRKKYIKNQIKTNNEKINFNANIIDDQMDIFSYI